MTGRRTYHDACGVARALDLVGERWALMIVRELLLGPKRFTDLRAGLPHLSPDVLIQRLRGLDDAGLVTRRHLPPPAASHVYELTELGRRLEPVILELGRFGSVLALPTGEIWMSFDAHILSLTTLFDPMLAGDLRASVDLHLGAERFSAVVTDGHFEIERGAAVDPDAIITSDPGTLIDVVHGRRELADAVRGADLTVHGDERTAARFLALFPLPDPVVAG